MKRIIFIFLILPVLLYSIDATVDNTTLYNTAVGGPHTGMAQGFDSFLNNPALLGEYDDEISFFEFGVNLKGDALSLFNLYFSDALSLDDPSALLDTLDEEGLTSLLIGLNLAGPISIGKIGNNWGWSLRNTSVVYLDVPGLLSTADIVAREDLMFSIGVAIPIKVSLGSKYFMEFTPGIMSRTTLRGEVYIESDLLGLLEYTDDFTTILDDYPLTLSPMFALDAGFIFNFYDLVKLSGVVKDIYTPILEYPVTGVDDFLSIFTSSDTTTGSLVYREINLGLSGDIPLGPLTLVLSDLDLYIDYFDLLDFDKNFWLHWGAGADIELLEKFHLLAGINEGLLSMGLNVDIGGFDVGFVMYGTEEGTQPGANTAFNFLFSMGISF